jgi:hypothetical protein
MSETGILQQLRHRSVVRGQQELPFWLALRQRYTTDRDPQHRICCGNSKLRVEAEGHLNALIELREHSFSSFRFPETKSAHLKFSPLSDYNPLEVAYMFARNVSFHLKSNMLSDYTRAFEKDALPLLRKQNGFKDEITLAGPGGVDVTAISLWENKKDADNYNTNTYPQVLKTLARFIEGTPQVHTFDVVTSTLQQHELVTA